MFELLQPLGIPPTLKELRDRLKRMDVKLYQHKYITFWDFASGLARLAFEEEAKRHQESFKVPQLVCPNTTLCVQASLLTCVLSLLFR